MSAKRSVAGISARSTPTLLRDLMQLLHMAGFPLYRPNPMCPMTAPPIPPNGASHSLQCGSDGFRRKYLRPRSKESPRRRSRISCSGVCPGIDRLYSRTHRPRLVGQDRDRGGAIVAARMTPT